MMDNKELFDEVAGTFKREVNVPIAAKAEVAEAKILRCRTCKKPEVKDPAGHSNIMYTYGVCIDCLHDWY